MGKKTPAHTQNVTCHLPKQIERQLIRYCHEHDILRKDKSGKIKPSLAIGIVEILEHFFAQDSSSLSVEDKSDSSIGHEGLTQAQLDASLEQAIASIHRKFLPMLKLEDSINQLNVKHESFIEQLSGEITMLQQSIEENLHGATDENTDEEWGSGMSRESLATIFDEPET